MDLTRTTTGALSAAVVVSTRRLCLYGADDTRREMHPQVAAGR
ncbi:hypothetical protein [Cellulomonas triticagri]|nr:hypothetical protein [Cellulomonas triticagri]